MAKKLDNNMQYIVEPGTFTVMVGANSEDLQQQDVVWDGKEKQ